MPNGTKNDPYLVVGYGRVSTDDQDTSIEAQRKLLAKGTLHRVKDYKNTDIWVKIIEYKEDEGESGANSKRDGLNSALEYIKSHSKSSCNGLLAKSSSRIYRDQFKFNKTINDFDKAGYFIFTLDEGEQTRQRQTDVGKRLSNEFTKLMNEGYVIQAQTNVNRSIITKFKKGEVVTPMWSAGHTYDEALGRYLPDENAAFIREAYKMFINNATYTEIGEYLQRKIPKKKFKNGKTKKASWSVSSVKRLLGSFRYAGLLINGVRTVSTDLDGVKAHGIHPAYTEELMETIKKQIVTFYSQNYVTTEEGIPQRVTVLSNGKKKNVQEATELSLTADLKKAYAEAPEDAGVDHGLYPAWVYVPLVDPETFLKAYEKIGMTEKRCDNTRLTPVAARLFRQKIHCNCGCRYKRYYSGYGDKKVYYAPITKTVPKGCKSHQRVFEKDLEEGLFRAFDKLVELMADPDWRHELLSDDSELRAKNRKARFQALEDEKTELEHKLKSTDKNMARLTNKLGKLLNDTKGFDKTLADLQSLTEKAKVERKSNKERIKEIDEELKRLEKELEDKALSEVEAGMTEEEIRYYLLTHLDDVTVGHPLGMKLNYKGIKQPDWNKKMEEPISSPDIITHYSPENCYWVDWKVCSRHQGIHYNKKPNTNWVQFTIDGVPILVFCRSEELGWYHAGRNKTVTEFKRPIYVNMEPFERLFDKATENMPIPTKEELLADFDDISESSQK